MFPKRGFPGPTLHLVYGRFDETMTRIQCRLIMGGVVFCLAVGPENIPVGPGEHRTRCSLSIIEHKRPFHYSHEKRIVIP
jgi:hypothetical protein